MYGKGLKKGLKRCYIRLQDSCLYPVTVKGRCVKVCVCVGAAGGPGGAAMHGLHHEGSAGEAVSVLRGLREPPLLPGNHVQRSGETQGHICLQTVFFVVF